MVSSHLLQSYEKDERSLIMKSIAREKFRFRSQNNDISMFQGLYLASFLYEDVNVLHLLTSAEEHKDEIRTFLNTVHVYSSHDDNCGNKGLFIAAAFGNQTLLREWFIFCCDCMVQDTKKRTALHYAADPNVLEFISLPTTFFCSVDYPKKVEEEWTKRVMKDIADLNVAKNVKGNPQSDASVDRQACILMLLRAGVELSQVDKKGNIPNPGSSCDAEFQRWWYNMVVKDSEDKQKSFNLVGNALSVVGTLVAATSYIGPLQPPFNYTHTEHNGFVDTSRSLVKVFMWTNTLAFYLAVASVMFAVVPSLTMPQEGVIEKVRRARRTVSSSFLLLASIVCILVSFAAATAVVVDNRDYYGANDFLLSPSVIGWFFCVIAMVSFFIRMMRLVFYRNPTIRQIYYFSFDDYLKTILIRSGRAVRKSHIERNYRRIIALPVLFLLIVPTILENVLIWMIFSISGGIRRLWKEQVRHQEPERPPRNEEEDNTPEGPISKLAQRLRNWVDEDENSTDEYWTDEEEK